MYANAMPRLMAGESLRRMSDLAAGTGAMKEQDQRQYRGDLVKQQNGGRPPRGEAATKESLEFMGIEIVERG